MLKKLNLLVLTIAVLFLFCLSANAKIFAQEKDAAKNEKAGKENAGKDGAGNCGTVVEWAGKIADKLKEGGPASSGPGFDVLSQALKSSCGSTAPESKQGGQYWCTNLIIDSYALAGIKIPRDLVAVTLYKKMKGLNGFGSAGPSGAAELKKVKPGYAIAFGKSTDDGPGGHIGIVKSLTVDDRGNGKIVTYESNSSAPSHTWPIANGKIGGKHKPILGFAGSDKGGGASTDTGGDSAGPGTRVSCVITKVGNPTGPSPTLPPECNTSSISDTTASGSATTGGYTAPSDNNCGGKYTKDMAKNKTKKNFGDPTCNYSKDKLLALIKEKDPRFANLWFYTIVKGESGWNPNALATGKVQDSIDSRGAWGNFQMSSSEPPGGSPDKHGKNDKGKSEALDRGDVNWEKQMENAIKYNKDRLNCSFRYWHTAKSRWGKQKC